MYIEDDFVYLKNPGTLEIHNKNEFFLFLKAKKTK